MTSPRDSRNDTAAPVAPAYHLPQPTAPARQGLAVPLWTVSFSPSPRHPLAWEAADLSDESLFFSSDTRTHLNGKRFLACFLHSWLFDKCLKTLL